MASQPTDRPLPSDELPAARLRDGAPGISDEATTRPMRLTVSCTHAEEDAPVVCKERCGDDTSLDVSVNAASCSVRAMFMRATIFRRVVGTPLRAVYVDTRVEDEDEEPLPVDGDDTCVVTAVLIPAPHTASTTLMTEAAAAVLSAS